MNTKWSSFVHVATVLIAHAVSGGANCFGQSFPISFQAGQLLPQHADPTSESGNPERAYLDGLRERKLYRLLERYCRKKLARSDVSPAEESRYTIELANILAARADEQTTAIARADLWQKASALLSDFLDHNPDHSPAITLRFQLGVYELAQGELLRQQAIVAPRSQEQELTKSARSNLLAAAQTLKVAEARVSGELKDLDPHAPSSPGRMGYKQLRALSDNIRFRFGQTWLSLARMAPRNSADRTEFATNAKNQFEFLTQRYSTVPIVQESYIGLIESLRLLGATTEAEKYLRVISKDTAPSKYQDQSLVLRVRLQLDRKKTLEARGFIIELRKILKEPMAELDLLFVEASLQLARQHSKANDILTARQLVREVLQAMHQIEKKHGAYWVARCELLLAELAAEDILVQDPRVLRRMGDGRYRKGDHEGAIATFDRAAQLAREQQDIEQTVALSFRAASIALELGELQKAAERFTAIANTYPIHPQAAQSHFLATYCIGQAYATNPTPERLVQYEEMLNQHVRMFRDVDTVSEARWLLGSLRMRTGKWADAIDSMSGIARDHKRNEEARHALGQAYERWLTELWVRSEPAEEVVGQAVRFLRRTLDSRKSGQLSSTDMTLALRLARIQIHPTVARYREAEEVLEEILFAQEADKAQKREARALTLISLLGQDRFDAAGRMLETEFVGVPEDLFAIVQTMEEAATRSNHLRRRQIGKLQLLATERLVQEAQRLTDAQKLQAQIYLALAYLNAGEATRAEELFQRLRDLVPDNPRVLEAQAECYMQLGRYGQARQLWRQLLALLPKNSTRWFEAKFNLALSCFRSGDIRQCLKIIQVTSVLYPELGGLELRTRFEDLKLKCEER